MNKIEAAKNNVKGLGFLVWFIGILIAFWIGWGLVQAVIQGVRKDKEIVDLVEQIQRDIDKVNKSSEWQVVEAEIEVSLALKEGVDSGLDVKAVGSNVSTERQEGHKLILTIHRTPPLAPIAATQDVSQ